MIAFPDGGTTDKTYINTNEVQRSVVNGDNLYNNAKVVPSIILLEIGCRSFLISFSTTVTVIL